MSNEPTVAENADSRYDLFVIFKQAVEDERKAQRIYAKALSLCTDPALRPILQQMIEDEARHEQILVSRYQALAKRGIRD